MRISRNTDTKLIKNFVRKMNKIYVNKFAFLLIVYRVKAMKLRQSDTDEFTNGFVDEMKEMMFLVNGRLFKMNGYTVLIHRKYV